MVRSFHPVRFTSPPRLGADRAGSTHKHDQDARYHLYSIWLFTRSDLKTIVVPKSIFGILGALPGSPLTAPSSASTPWPIILRSPLVVFWVWIVLLPFNIDNQRRPAAIEEDKVNRPWRPLPAKRISPDQAARLEFALHVVAIIYSWTVGGLRQSLTGILLGWLYNGTGWADRSCIAKNAVNALGYVTFSTGAISVAAHADFSDSGMRWFCFIGAVVFSTVHIQDLPDMQGDAKRCRRTAPLVIGPNACRWTIALLVPFWTAGATVFWGSLSLSVLVCTILGLTTSWRILKNRHMADDKITFRIWNLWIVSLYVLPLTSSRSGLGASRLGMLSWCLYGRG